MICTIQNKFRFSKHAYATTSTGTMLLPYFTFNFVGVLLYSARNVEKISRESDINALILSSVQHRLREREISPVISISGVSFNDQRLGFQPLLPMCELYREGIQRKVFSQPQRKFCLI